MIPPRPSTTVDGLLTDEMLARFDERAPRYDRENRFFDEDFDELRESGYLILAVPTEFGGSGLGLDEYSQLVRRLAYVAPATALAVNMHIYWTGVAADLLRNGDDSCRFILEKAAEGEIFAAIHGEAGNDMPLLLSSAQAERVDGGWKINGHKIFGSLTPVWTYGGFHAMDTSDPAGPRIVHGFVPRDTHGAPDRRHLGHARHAGHPEPGHGAPPGVRARRAGARRVPGRVRRRRPVPRVHLRLGADGLRLRLPRRRPPGLRPHRRQDAQPPSIALTSSMAHHPEVQHNVTEMRMALDAAEALLDRTTDWATGVAHATGRCAWSRPASS